MQKTLNDAFVIAYGRSPIARGGKKGALRSTHPVDLAGQVLGKVLSRVPGLKPGDLDDVIVGCSRPEGMQGNNFARLIASRAGCPWDVPGQTVNRFCSSGLQAITAGANMIMTGQAGIIAAGGMESMSSAVRELDPNVLCKWIQDNDPGQYLPMGITAENVAARFHITREEMDAFALESHRRAARAMTGGRFDEEIIPVPGVDEEGNPITFSRDQGVRPDTSLEALAALKPSFREDGLVTPGQSSQVSDGTSFVILASAEKVKELGIAPVARFLGFAVAGVDPSLMGIGPIKAVPKVMKLTGLSIADMDVIELNEAFAAQAIPCIRELGLDTAKVNPNGGAIALGHPTGATGAILSCKAFSELKRRGGRYALISMCVGGGMGAACIWEKI
jgi:acetyl-CoA acyltransferase